MARMGHDSERAAITYQHAARGAGEAISKAMDATSGPSGRTMRTGTMALMARWSRRADCTREGRQAHPGRERRHGQGRDVRFLIGAGEERARKSNPHY